MKNPQISHSCDDWSNYKRKAGMMRGAFVLVLLGATFMVIKTRARRSRSKAGM
jgi:hypothetical protein